MSTVHKSMLRIKITAKSPKAREAEEPEARVLVDEFVPVEWVEYDHEPDEEHEKRVVFMHISRSSQMLH